MTERDTKGILEQLRDSFARLARESADRDDKEHANYRAGLSDGFNIALGLVRYQDERSDG